jgi:nitrate reductase (cytochrome), electron transfer subunit
MRILLRCCTVASLVTLLALPVVVCAEEEENYDKDAQYAESTPPMIPHRFKDTADGNYCLDCHRTGVSGAPMTPHPERLSCTGCHAQGEIKDVKPLKKGKNKK